MAYRFGARGRELSFLRIKIQILIAIAKSMPNVVAELNTSIQLT